MDVLDKFLNSVAYKFPKGYPDINDKQDVLLLETLLKELGVEIKIEEANLMGSATGFSGPLGTFEKYITNAWLGHIDNETVYKVEKDTKLGRTQEDGDFVLTDETIKKGEEITISSSNTKDLIQNKRIYYAPVKYKGKDYYVALNAILKPTGKNVEKLVPNLSSKSNPGVYHLFTPGHPQEGKIAMLFIEQTDNNWGFEYKGDELNVTYLGDPDFKGAGYPKSDLQVNFNKPPQGLEKDLKVSLKADNATYVENWMLSSRGEQIFGTAKLKDIVLGAYNALIESDNLRAGNGLFAGVLKSSQICMFIKDRPSSLGPAAPSILTEPLSDEEAYEAYTGDKKFGDRGSANYFYKGKDPDNISEFLSNLKPFKNNMENLSKLYVSLRGSNESGKTNSRVFYWDDKLNTWVINPLWAERAGIQTTTDDNGKPKYV